MYYITYLLRCVIIRPHFNPLRAKFYTYIYILCHYSKLIWHKYLKLFLK